MSMDSFGIAGGQNLDVTASRDMVTSAKGVLIDWDGCLAFGNRPTSDAIAFLKRCADRVAIVSNSSSSLPEDILTTLEGCGVRFDAGRLFLAGVEAIRRAAARGTSRAQVLGDRRMRALARNAGMTLVRDGGETVVLLRDRCFSYARLERAANALRGGARLIVANPDLTHPGPDGAIVPETGALLAAVAACVDLDSIEVEMIGKPSPGLFQQACAAIGVEPSQAVMIGDNPVTDVVGARAIGMPAIRFERTIAGFFEILL